MEKLAVILISLIVGIGFGAMLLGLFVVVFDLELKLWMIITTIIAAVLSTWNTAKEINGD